MTHPLTRHVDPDAFASEEELTEWHQLLDDRGLRATGSPEHHEYVEDLARRLRSAGVTEVHTEEIPMRRWTPAYWGLELDGEHPTELAVASYVAYSGRTGSDGVVGALSSEPAAGTIGIAEIPLVSLSASDFDALDWDAPRLPHHDADYAADAPYRRAWLSQDLMREALDRYQAAGAAGLVLAIDLPAEAMTDGYLIYDGVHRDIPALFVDRETGRRLREAEESGASARLTLRADVVEVSTLNLVGVVPGATAELVVLQSHTDGTNALEDNGPEAIVAMAAYLSAMPRAELPRSILVLLTAGHFAIEEAWGLEAFLDRHRDDVVPRIAAALCLEHLGALPSRTDEELGLSQPDFEFGCFFASPHRAVIDVLRSALDRARVTESRVLRPYVPAPVGHHSPDGLSWPGDGGPFWHTAGLPTGNFISGPDYLLNVEPVLEHIDIAAVRRQLISFTEATLALSAVPWKELHTRLGEPEADS